MLNHDPKRRDSAIATQSLLISGTSKGGKGVIRLPNRDSRGKSCHVNFIPEGDDVRVETNCSASFCGHNAWIDGLYTRVP